MFNREQLPDLSVISDFIQKPAQNCTEEELILGVNDIIFLLNKNPDALIDILDSDPVIAATYLFDDLMEKLASQQQTEKISLLLDKCLNRFIESCVCNSHDLDRAVKAFPRYQDKILKALVENKPFIKRLLEADDNLEQTIKVFNEKYPSYHQALERYHFIQRQSV